MVNIGDVARTAGVSRSTASYALSGKRPISAEVRNRVAEAVRELGFIPNAGARALATSETKVLGLLARFLPDEFAPAMLEYILAVTERARELGYDILLVSDEDGVAALERYAASRMVDGFVLLNVAEHDDRLGILRGAPQPAALVGLPANTEGLDVFDLDFEAAGEVMVDHLHALGHRELILVSQPEHVVQRGGAYVWRLANAAARRAEERGIRLHMHFGSSEQPAIGTDLHAFLDAHPQATGLLLNNEAAAAALPGVLHSRNLRSPEDISVVGRYSDDFARTFSLPFSAVDSAARDLGSRAVERLIERIGGEPSASDIVELVTPTITERGSTAPPNPSVHSQ